MAIQLPHLPYSVDALEPYMSRQTLEVHHGKHHKKYVDTLNELIKDSPLDQRNLGEIIFLTANEKEKIYNNAAQAWNHTFFWNCMIDSAQKPSANLKRTLEKTFGSFDDFKSEFTMQGKDLFGSGWTWLVKDKNGRLQIRPMKNAGNPFAELNEIPLLVCDVWEHAYYLDYKNDRSQFLENFWKIVDWDFVETNLEQQMEENLLPQKMDEFQSPKSYF